VNLGDLFFRLPRATILALLVALAMGLTALATIGRQEDPAFTNILAWVLTFQPGADAARVEAQVTEPIERRLSEIPEIKMLRSNSRAGLSTIIVQLDTDLPPNVVETAFSRVRDALEDVSTELPPDARKPIFDDARGAAYTSISAIVPKHESTPLSLTTRYAESLRDDLQSLPGIKRVRIFGAAEEEISVTVDPWRLAALGWSPARLAVAIEEADPKTSAGRAVGAGSDLIVEVAGGIADLTRIQDIPLLVSSVGTSIRVGDIATVAKGEREPPYEIAFADGRRGVLVAVMMENGQRVDTFMEEVRTRMAAFDKTLPGGLEHIRIFDQSTYTAARLKDLSGKLFLGFLGVIAVLVFTLGLRSALIAGIALPVVSLTTLGTMGFLDISIDQMSVAGLIVALGMLVDAAIVMVDEIRKRVDAGAPHAVAEAVRWLTAPLAASTLTTVLAFLPMAMLPGPPGDFLGPVAQIVIIIVVWSFLTAVTVTAALAGWMLKPQPEGRRPSLMQRGLPGGALAKAFLGLLNWALRRPRAVVVYGLILPLAGYAVMPSLTPQFFPAVERDQFYIEIETASSVGIAPTAETALTVDAILADDERIAGRAWTVGRSPPPFYYNMVENRDLQPNFASALITTVSPAATAELLGELQPRLDAAVPHARVLVRELVQGPPVIAPVELRLMGPDLEELKTLAARAMPIIEALPSVTSVRSSLGSGPPKLQFVPDEEKVRAAGLTLDEVALYLQATLEGAEGGSLIEGVERLTIRVRTPESFHADWAALSSLPVIPAGRSEGVPLSALGTIELVSSDAVITRHDTERANTIEAFPRTGRLPQAVVDEAVAALEAQDFTLPRGYRLEIGGDSDARTITIEHLRRPAGLLLVIAFAVSVLAFNSFRLSLVAAFASVLFAGLSILSVAAFGFPLGVPVVVGIIGSIGVSINDTIIVLTALQNDPKAARGDPRAAAATVLDAGRHVLSTTITTVAGFLPLALGGGRLWPPFAVAVVGGVALSTIITLFLAPALFLLVYTRRGAPATAEPQTAE
jgi:multidrug efflux pump subunit AcrB